MWNRIILKNNAKIVFRQNYWKTVLVAFILILINSSINEGVNIRNTSRDLDNSNFGFMIFISLLFIALTVYTFALVIGIALNLFVFAPLEVSCRRFLISARTAPGDLSLLSYAFKDSYLNIIKTQFLRNLFIFLWSLLFIVPGIIKAYEYRMMPYLLAENPGIDSNEAFIRSKEMMAGHKWDTFVLDLSFLGWHLLGALTCFLLTIFYVNPYQQLTNAELYEALRINYKSNNPYN